jgi:thiosulfate reductase cytochrome b subunit
MSGMQIFNAHPQLYWGQKGADADPAAFEIGAEATDTAHPVGFVRAGKLKVTTTGVLGWSMEMGQGEARAFPAWLTVPSFRDLASGRRWHFFWAWALVLNGLVYLGFGLARRHIQRDLLPTPAELKLSHILHDIIEHARLRFPRGEAAKRYNVLQKLAYVGVIFLVLPVMVLSGLTMSPGFDSAAPWLLDLFGARQSARTIHFITANLVVAFIIVHLTMVLLAGPINEVRSMITGRYEIRPDEEATP